MTARLALVTGASSGIGAALARLYASHGYDLAITARRGERLDAIAEEIRFASGVEVLPLPADLANPASPRMLVDQIDAAGRHVDALINNAGYGLPGAFGERAFSEEQAFIQVLVTSVCALTHAVLPGMRARRFGRILNVASLAGLAPGGPGSAVYGAAKAFVVQFSQSVHLETRSEGVHVSALCPGFTYSEFHDVNGARASVEERIPTWMWMGADEVAAAGYEAAEANRPICVPGAANKGIAALTKLLPADWGMALMARQAWRGRNI